MAEAEKPAGCRAVHVARTCYLFDTGSWPTARYWNRGPVDGDSRHRRQGRPSGMAVPEPGVTVHSAPSQKDTITGSRQL